MSRWLGLRTEAGQRTTKACALRHLVDYLGDGFDAELWPLVVRSRGRAGVGPTHSPEHALVERLDLRDPEAAALLRALDLSGHQARLPFGRAA